MLKNKYLAVKIYNNRINQEEVSGTLHAIGDYILRCERESIITLYTLEGTLFLVGMGQKILECKDKAFWHNELRPYLSEKGKKE